MSSQEEMRIRNKEISHGCCGLIQYVIEKIVLKITRNISENYEIQNLCLAGGVALNCVANGKVLEDGKFKNIWVQPAAGDAGGAIGSALAFHYRE